MYGEKAKQPINLHIPTSYFMLKVSQLSLGFISKEETKKLEIDIKSFKICDTTLTRSKQAKEREDNYGENNNNYQGENDRHYLFGSSIEGIKES